MASSGADTPHDNEVLLTSPNSLREILRQVLEEVLPPELCGRGPGGQGLRELLKEVLGEELDPIRIWEGAPKEVGKELSDFSEASDLGPLPDTLSGEATRSGPLKEPLKEVMRTRNEAARSWQEVDQQGSSSEHPLPGQVFNRGTASRDKKQQPASRRAPPRSGSSDPPGLLRANTVDGSSGRGPGVANRGMREPDSDLTEVSKRRSTDERHVARHRSDSLEDLGAVESRNRPRALLSPVERKGRRASTLDAVTSLAMAAQKAAIKKTTKGNAATETGARTLRDDLMQEFSSVNTVNPCASTAFQSVMSESSRARARSPVPRNARSLSPLLFETPEKRRRAREEDADVAITTGPEPEVELGGALDRILSMSDTSNWGMAASEPKEVRKLQSLKTPTPPAAPANVPPELEPVEPVRTGRVPTCRKNLRLFVESVCFDFTISGVIILNAVTIGLQSNYEVTHIDEKEAPAYFQMFERFFAVVFLMELMLRIMVNGRTFFVGSEWRWNHFDAVIVAFQVLEEISSHVAESTESYDTQGGNFSFLRIMRLLRLVRIMRLVRLLRFVQELRTMVSSIAGSVKSLCWTLLLMLMLMYVVGVYLTQAIADEARRRPHIMSEDSPLYQYYGNLFRSVLSLYQAITGGVDWNDIVVPLEVHVSGYLVFVFLLYTAFAILAMLNVITGVFVESALLTAKQDREVQVVGHVRRLFHLTDQDRSGTITWQEFTSCLDMPEMESYMQALEIDTSEARGLFMLLDTDQSGEIDSQEFIQGFLRLRGPARAIDLATLMYFNKRMVAWWREHMGQTTLALEEIQQELESRPRRLSYEGSPLVVLSDVEADGNEQVPRSARNSLDSTDGHNSPVRGPDRVCSASFHTTTSVVTSGSQHAYGGLQGELGDGTPRHFNHRKSNPGWRSERSEDPMSARNEESNLFATWEEIKNAGNARRSIPPSNTKQRSSLEVRAATTDLAVTSSSSFRSSS